MRVAKFPKYFLLIFLTIGLAGCRSSPAFNFGSYSEAERFYEKGKYAQAIEKYQEYLRENPEGNMAVISSYYMAKSYENLGDRDRAAEIYKKIVQGHPQLIWADFSKTRLSETPSQKSRRSRSPQT